jgi:hypothetical protein
LIFHLTSESAAPAVPCDYAYVRLRHVIQSGETTYAESTRGVVVHRHADGLGYEVECEQLTFRVVTLTGRDIRPTVD